VKDGATKCISFWPEVKVPTFDKRTAERYMKGSVLKAAGRVGQKIEIPFFFWIFMVMLLALSVLQLLVSTGRIYI